MNVCTFVVPRIPCVDTHQTAHRVSSVQSALRTAKHIHALYFIETEIESRFVHVWDIIHIKSDGRRVDPAAYASDIHSTRKATAIVWNEQIRHQSANSL